MSEEKPLYKITRGKEYITITTGYRGIDIEFYKNKECQDLWRIFFDLLKEGQESGEVSDSAGYAPDKYLADEFLDWLRTKHPETGEFQAEYIGEDVSWWENGDFRSVRIPDYVKVTEDGHWVDKETGINLDDEKGLSYIIY